MLPYADFGHVIVVDHVSQVEIIVSSIGLNIDYLFKEVCATQKSISEYECRRISHFDEKLMHHPLSQHHLRGNMYDCSFEFACNSVHGIIDLLTKEAFELQKSEAPLYTPLSVWCNRHGEHSSKIRALIHREIIPAFKISGRYYISADLQLPKT